MQNQGTPTQQQSGFSLIELLVVVAIIGILSGIGVVSYTKYLDGVKADTQKLNAQTLAKSLSNIATLKTGGLTVKETGCDKSSSDSSVSATVAECTAAIVQNNGWKSPYNQAAGASYVLTSGSCASAGNLAASPTILVTTSGSGASATGVVSDCASTPNTFNFTAW